MNKDLLSEEYPNRLSRATYRNQAVYTLTSNHLGTPVAMFDEQGKKVWHETLDLWGKPHEQTETRIIGGARITKKKPREVSNNPAYHQPFKFPGQYEDEETGLYYNRFRYYMPEEGIYTQRDPIGLAGGNPTVYGYVYNTNSQIDPWGLINFNDYTDERLLEKIWELAYRDKRFPGNSGGTHGVIHRIKEQVQGKMRPPHPGWDTHDNQIKSGLKNLRKALDEARKRGPKFISKVNGKMPNVNKVAALNPPKPTDTKVPRLCR